MKNTSTDLIVEENGEDLTVTATSTADGCNDVVVGISTNGTQGGDAGHGGYLLLTVELPNGLDFAVTQESGMMYLKAKGDWETSSLLSALKKAVDQAYDYYTKK